jgi:hypothetical protein
VRRQRVERGRPHSLDIASSRRRGPQRAVHLLRQQRDRPVELGDRRLQVNLRRLRETGPRRRQRVGHRGQPAGQRAQPVGQRRVVPREQHVERLAGVGEQRVPGVLAQLLDLEQAAGHVVGHQRGVHPQLGRERHQVQVGEPGGVVVEAAPLVGERRLRPVREQAVEPVITKLGGGIRMAAHQVIEVAVGEPT